MPFGQLVLGPPGSGKTTYCHGMAHYMRTKGRKVAIVNLDPANDVPPTNPDVDIADLVDLASVQEETGLGPNGGLLYCMDYLEKNMDWLHQALQPYLDSNTYLLFDLPGQVELFTLHEAFKRIVSTLTDSWHLRLAAVYLVDAHLCTDASKYIACLTLALNTMLHLELPHVNVLSKVDLVRQYGKLAFNLDFYTEVQDLRYLIMSMGTSPWTRKYRKLSEGLCEIVESYGLVNFVPLAIQDQKAVGYLLGLLDKANGYVYASLATGRQVYPPELIYGAAIRGEDTDLWADLQEKYIDGLPAVQEQQGLLGWGAPSGAEASSSSSKQTGETEPAVRGQQGVQAGAGARQASAIGEVVGPGSVKGVCEVSATGSG